VVTREEIDWLCSARERHFISGDDALFEAQSGGTRLHQLGNVGQGATAVNVTTFVDFFRDRLFCFRVMEISGQGNSLRESSGSVMTGGWSA